MSDSQLTHILLSLERLETGQTGLHSRIDRIEAGQTQLRADVMERLDRLQSRIDTMREEAFVSFGRTESVQRHADATRDELRE